MRYKINFFGFAENCYGAAVENCEEHHLDRVFDDPRVNGICEEVAALNAKGYTTEEEKRANKEAANQLKRQLPVIMPHANFRDGKRRNENADESPWVSMDYDDIDNPAQIWEEKVKPFAMKLGCPLAFVSPSGRGLKFLVALPEGMNREQAQAWMGRQLGMDNYDHTHDLARCCYLVGRSNLLHYDQQLLFSLSVLLPNPEDVEVTDYKVVEDSQTNGQEGSDEKVELNYLGIPYTRIINKYWDLFNGGHTPMVSNRNALTYDLAYHLRAITGYNRELLDKIIPCYDGFSESEKLKCIDSALSRGVSGISEKMKKVLEELKKEYVFDEKIFKALEEAEEVNENFDYEQLLIAFQQKGAKVKGMPRHEKGKLPPGLRHTLESMPTNMVMPAIVGTAPMLGVLASEVRLKYETKTKALNLQSYIVGGAGSGKSKFDDLDQVWMKQWRELQKVEEAKDEEYEELRKQKKNAKDQPKDPCAQVLELSPRTSTAKVLRRLKNAKGRVCYTYSAEMDMSSASGGQSWNKDLGVIARCAFDETCYSTDYQNTETGRIVIPHVRWNRIMCGTPDALYRSLRNYTDGEITRVGIAAMPCNTFSAYVKNKERSTETLQKMEHLSFLLMKMRGEVELKVLEGKGHEWQERIRKEALFADDKVMADQRYRIPYTAIRMTCGFMLLHLAAWLIEQLDCRKGELPEWAHGCETAERYLEQHPDAVGRWLPMFQNTGWVRFYEVLCDYMLRTVLTYFRSRIEKAYHQDNYVVADMITSQSKTGGNYNIFEALGQTFTIEEALVARGDNNPNANRCMLKNWKRKGMVKSSQKGIYEKIA